METFSKEDISKIIPLRLSDLDSDCGTSISRKPENPLCVINNSLKNTLTLPATKMISSEKFWEKQQETNITLNDSSNLSTFKYPTKKSVPKCESPPRKYPVEIRMWSVRLNETVLTVQGVTSGGERIEKQVQKRISSYIFTDNNDKICSLSGPQDITRMPRMEPYIQFESGIPENWKSICHRASDNFFLKPTSKCTNNMEYKNSHTELVRNNKCRSTILNKLESARRTLPKRTSGVSQPANSNNNPIASNFAECEDKLMNMSKRQHEIYIRNYLKKKIEKYQAMYNATLVRGNLDSDDSMINDCKILENRPFIKKSRITEEKIPFKLDDRRIGAQANINLETSSKGKLHFNRKKNIKRTLFKKSTLSQDSECYVENSSYSSSESVQNKSVKNNDSKLQNLNSQVVEKESVAPYQESTQNILKLMNCILPTDNFKVISFHQNKSTMDKSREHSNSTKNSSIHARKLEEINQVVIQNESDCENISEHSSNSSVDIKNLFKKTSQSISKQQVNSKKKLEFAETNFNRNQMRETSTPNIKKQSNVNAVLTKKQINDSVHATQSNFSIGSKNISSNAKDKNIKRKIRISTARKYSPMKCTEQNIIKEPDHVCINTLNQNDANSDVMSESSISADKDFEQNLESTNRSCKVKTFSNIYNGFPQNTIKSGKCQYSRNIHKTNHEYDNSDDSGVSNDINYNLSKSTSNKSASKGLLFYQDESTDENAEKKMSPRNNSTLSKEKNKHVISPKMEILKKSRITKKQTLTNRVGIKNKEKRKENSKSFKMSLEVQKLKILDSSSDQEKSNVCTNESESTYFLPRKHNTNKTQAISDIRERILLKNTNLTETLIEKRITSRKEEINKLRNENLEIVRESSESQNANSVEITSNEIKILTRASSTRNQNILQKRKRNIPPKISDGHETGTENEENLISHSSVHNNKSKRNNLRNSKKSISQSSYQSTSNYADMSYAGNVSVSKRGRNRCSALPFWLGARLLTNEKETHIKCDSSIQQPLSRCSNAGGSKKKTSEVKVISTEKSVQDHNKITTNEISKKKSVSNKFNKASKVVVGKSRDGSKSRTEMILIDLENEIQTEILPDDLSANARERSSTEEINFKKPRLPLKIMCKHDKTFLDSLMENSIILNNINTKPTMYNSRSIRNISAGNKKRSTDTSHYSDNTSDIDLEHLKKSNHLNPAEIKTRTPLKNNCSSLTAESLREEDSKSSTNNLNTATRPEEKYGIRECHILLTRNDLLYLKQNLKNEKMNKNKYDKDCNRKNVFRGRVSRNTSSLKRITTKLKYPNTFKNRISYLQPRKSAAIKSMIAENNAIYTQPYVETDQQNRENKSGKRKLFSQKEWSKSELNMEIRDSPVRTFKINLNTVREECDEDVISEVSAFVKK